MTETLDILIRERGARVVRRSIDGIATSAEGAGAATSALRTAVAGLAGVLASAATLQAADAYNRIQNAIRVSIQPTQDLADTTERLFDIARDTRSEIEANARLYNRLSLAASELGADQEQLFTFLETTGKALAIQGTSAESARGALLQLAQATGAGIVRAEEFNSILEGALPIAQAAAAGIERTGGSVAKLRTEIIEGTVTSKEFFDAILSQSEEIERRFGETVVTLGQAFTNLNTSFTQFVGEIDQSVGVTRTMAQTLTLLANNLDIVLGTLGTLTALIATRYVSILIGSAIPATLSWVAGLSSLNIAMAATTLRTRVLTAALALLGGPAGIIGLTVASMGLLVFAMNRGVDAFTEFNVQITKTEDLLAQGLITTRAQADALLKEAEARRENIKSKIEDRREQVLLNEALLDYSQVGAESEAAEILRSLTLQLERQKVVIQDLIDLRRNLTSGPGSDEELSKAAEKRADAVKELEERLNPVLAAERELIEAEQLLNTAIAEGTATVAQREEILQRLRDSLNDQLEPYQTVVSLLSEEAQLLRLTSDEREVQIELLRIENGLRREGVTLLPEERARLEVQLRELETLRQRAAVLDEIREPMQTYIDQQRILNDLLAEGAITQEQAATRLRDLRIQFLETQTDFTSGIERGILKMQKDIEDYASIAEGAVTSAFEGMSRSLAQFVVKGEADFGRLVESMLADLIQLSIKALALPFIQQLFGSVAGAPAFGAGAPAFGAGLGGVGAGAGFTPNAEFLQKGGIVGAAGNPTVTVPTAAFRNAPRFKDGGMAAVVHRGEGVFTPEQMDNADRLLRSSGKVEVNIYNNANGTQTTTRQRDNGRGGQQIDVMIDEINAQLLQRPGSRTSQALKNNYGAERATIGRG